MSAYSSLILANANLVGYWRLGEIGGTGGQFSRGYLRLTGQSGNYASTPDSAALSLTGDIDIRVKVAMDDWTPGATQALVAKRGGSSLNSYMAEVSTAGKITLVLSADGTAETTATSSVAAGFTDGTTNWVRATWRQSDGRVQFFTSSNGTAWTQLGTDQSIAIASIADTASQLEIGSRSSGTIDNLKGNVYSVSVRNNILDDGTGIVASPDFTAVAAATSVFQDNQLNTWTVKSILARDAKGTNDGIYLPFTAPTTWTGGTLNQTGALTGSGDTDKAAIFNGTTGYSVVGSSVLGSTPSAFSLECWAKGAAQANRNLVALGRSSSNAPVIRLGTGSTTSSKLRLRVQNDASTAVKDFESSADAFDGSNFYHLAATYDSTNGAILYVNGVASGSSSGAYSGTINIDRTAIGTLVQAANSGFFSGTIDDAAIYNAALDAATILSHYNAGKFGRIPDIFRGSIFSPSIFEPSSIRR